MGQSGRDWLGRVMERSLKARSGGGILIQRVVGSQVVGGGGRVEQDGRLLGEGRGCRNRQCHQTKLEEEYE